MADYEQTTKTNPRRPDCVTKIRMGNSVLVVSGYERDPRWYVVI